MAYSNQVKYLRREFLNHEKVNSTAMIYACVDDEDYVELKIADCDRVVTLDIQPGQRDPGNAIDKIDILVSVLRGLRPHVVKLAKKKGWDPKGQK